MIRPSLQSWINDADNLRHLRHFSIAESPVSLAKISTRYEDYYISLVGELFTKIDSLDAQQSDWAQLGNAFLQFSSDFLETHLGPNGISKDDARLFSAAAFYFGDYPASACLTMRSAKPSSYTRDIHAACYEFLARPGKLRSKKAIEVRDLILNGNLVGLEQLVEQAQQAEREALQIGPEPWIAAKLLSRLLRNFTQTNIRAVLPDGQLDVWNPFVKSLIERQPSTWEFFPSQIQAISNGFLASTESFSLQMPTGAGKTTLCETLLFWHLINHPDDVAVMLVPYRSLASELRNSLVRRLNAIGLAARCAYGGTVPTGDEVHGLAAIRAVIATPEALSGLLGADLEFAKKIGLVICDEGHLLDGEGRGIGLELLLARLKARQSRNTRFVFMSAIVPNIDEINAWLGGSNETVIRSTYQPAIAEFAVLTPVGTGIKTVIGLEMHPHETDGRKFTIDDFLDKRDFSHRSAKSQRLKTYNFTSIKTQIIAAARKSLAMGATAIFAMNKRGQQGAIGIAESLIEQLQEDLPLPKPINYSVPDVLQKNIDYLTDEYGADWIGTQCIVHGAILHHGDIPQETREVLESLVRNHSIKLIICTSTLAEGVNLPIRTLILYSVQRRSRDGRLQKMLARDIKNLVGRAGRAGANTKGLVICANPELWKVVQPVAMQGAGEIVRGSLLRLINNLTRFLSERNIALSNEFMERSPIIHPIIDGVDSTLIELLSDEIGEEEFVALATDLAAQTFAASQLAEASAENLRSIFALRAKRLFAFREGGKTTWARDTGAKIRLIDSVEQALLPIREDWQNDVEIFSSEFQEQLFNWAWLHPELLNEVKSAFRLKDEDNPESVKKTFFEVARLWIAGFQFHEIASQVHLSMDDLLLVHSRAIAFSLQILVEQGISLLEKRLESEQNVLNEAVRNFPDHLRFGVPTSFARMLAAGGVRHRKACVHLGRALSDSNAIGSQSSLKFVAESILRESEEEWREALGDLIYQNTLTDLTLAS